MIKVLFLLLFVFSFMFGEAQVGINTENPRGIFHVDGQGNNPVVGVPTLAQSVDDLVMQTNGYIGVGTGTPQKNLHVNGSLQITNELNVGGNATTAGNAGTSGQVLTSSGVGVSPAWQSVSEVHGTIASITYVQGTTELTIPEGSTADVPGVVATLTVPPDRTQTFLFTILCYSNDPLVAVSTQGVFSLLQNNVKISSAYTSETGAAGGGLTNLPSPVTFLKEVTLSAGTYTFKVQYSAWHGLAKVNVKPTAYIGYDGDVEAMLTKMQILVYNN